jgi:radical SAM protein with 4Fe4S-binding SPASM domain
MVKKRTIRTIWFTVNRKCNFRCPWCYAKSSGYQDDNMSISTLNNLMEFAEYFKVPNVLLIGGEPTVYPHLEYAISALSQKGIGVNLVSNGFKFSSYDFASKMKDLGLERTSISLKGLNEEEYFHNTGIKALPIIMKAVENLKSLNIRFHLSITLSEKMLQRSSELLHLLSKIDPPSVFIEYVNPTVVDDRVQTVGVPSPSQIAESFIQLHGLLKQGGHNCSFNLGIPLCLFSTDFIDEIEAEGKTLSVCHARGGSGVVFLQNGDVIPCHQFMSNTLGEFGLDYKTPEEFETFWNGQITEEFYALTNRLPAELCSKCSLWEKCGGGCFLRWFYFQPKNVIIGTTYTR